jgi:hypothetical protein
MNSLIFVVFYLAEWVAIFKNLLLYDLIGSSSDSLPQEAAQKYAHQDLLSLSMTVCGLTG